MMDAITGKELIRVPTGASFRTRFKYPYIVVHRIDVHNVLLDACRRCGTVELVADAMVTGFEERGDSVSVNTADGRVVFRRGTGRSGWLSFVVPRQVDR